MSVNGVYIEPVDLSSRRVVFPSDRVGMVMAQPHLSLSTTEPYRCIAQAKARQLATLTETLAVARAASHGVSKTHFTVFPEYSIPGLEGIALVSDTLGASTWPHGTVVIGGVDALTKAEYHDLLAGQSTHVDTNRNGDACVGNDEWVNCAIIWVKGDDGTLERWIQPKLHPAWAELNILHRHMFRGSSVYLFNGLLSSGVPYHFCTLVCFDWIATIDRHPDDV